MQPKNILNIKTKEEFYSRLKENHNKESECRIDCKRWKIKDDDNFYYIEAVYMALCFGWIDSVHKEINWKRLQKLSPRKKWSPWWELNKERCKWLIKKWLMQESWLKELPDLDEEFKIDNDILELIQKDKEILKNFNSFPELYQRIRIWNIQRERDKPLVFQRMLNHFLQETKNGKMYGERNDYGRLLN